MSSQEAIDTAYQVNQVDNEIFYDGNEPERDHRFRCYEYKFFVFYKLAMGYSRIDNPVLEEGWHSSGKWRLGEYTVEQYDGVGPVTNANRNEMLVRSLYNSYLSRGYITEFKIRYKYPQLP